MTQSEIVHQRLYNHQLLTPTMSQPEQVVAWLGAVQAQDYAGAKWSLAQRLTQATDAAIEQAFNEGSIIRTHLLRPTWHFVAPLDVRWLLMLTALRVHALNASYYRKAGLDEATLARSHEVLLQTLQGNQQLTREELCVAWEKSGITTQGELRVGYLLMHAELAGIICSGGRRGKQFTYALLEERIPPAPPLTREEALVELVKRYFFSHGPATVHDFVWWSGLTVADAKAGIEMAGQALVQTTIHDKPYWHEAAAPLRSQQVPVAYLLPTYDEFLLSYSDRSASLNEQDAHMWNGVSSLFTSSIVIDGRVVGVWRRTLRTRTVEIEAKFFRHLDEREEQAFLAATQRFGEFLGAAVVLKSIARM